jgi:hypothetical protein
MEKEEAARTRGEEVVMTNTWCAYTKIDERAAF